MPVGARRLLEGGRYSVQRARRWGDMAVVGFILLILLAQTQGHTKYPEIEVVLKQLSDSSTMEELEAQVHIVTSIVSACNCYRLLRGSMFCTSLT